MPTLKQITCVVECGEKNIRLREHQTAFTDGFVSSYIAVPSQPTNFSIHVTSEDYIAPGLAMFVFIDGVAQCNRNRTGLIYPGKKTGKDDTEIDFRVRQKEEKFADGKWLGREWKWESLNVAAADAMTTSQRPDILHAVGTIEVVILRCRIDEPDAPDSKAAKTKGDDKKMTSPEKQVRFKVKGSTQDSYMHGALNLDGAGDDKPEKQKDPYKEWLKQEYKRVKEGKAASSAAPTMPGGWPQNFGQAAGPSNMTMPGAWPQNLSQSAFQPNMPWQQNFTPEQQAEMARQRAQWFYNMNPAYGSMQFPTGGIIGGGMYTSKKGGKKDDDDQSDWGGNASTLSGLSTKSKKSKKSDKQDNTGWGNNDTSNGWGNNDTSNGWGDNSKQDTGNNSWGGNANQDTTTSGGWSEEKKDEDKKDDNSGGGWNNTSADAWNEEKKDEEKKDQNDTWNTTPADDWNNNTDSKQDDNNKHDNNNNNNSGWGDSTNQSGDGWNTDNNNNVQTTTTTTEEKKPKEAVKRTKKNKKTQETSTPAPAHPVSLKAPKPIDPSRPLLKPYFSTWSQDPSTTHQPYLVPEEPLPQVPKRIADDTQASHQTQAGKGVLYSHRTGRPKYIDTMQKPYAVFVFKYRSREKLAQILNVDVDKIKEDKEDIRKKLKIMSREELIEQFMKAKAKAGYDTNSSLDSSESEAEAEVATAGAKENTQPGKTEKTSNSWENTAAGPSTGW